MQQNITISIIAPIYGVENYIVEFANSILSQSYPHIEFIFVNDGTKDRSIELLEELIAQKYEHLRPQIKIVHKANGGLPAARRTGLEHATGDYIYNVDSDDWLSEGSIAKIAAKIAESGADIVYFNYVKEYPTRSSVKKERAYGAGEQRLYVRNMYNHRSFGTLCNKCVRRALFTENDIAVPKYGYAEDCFVSTQIVGLAKSVAYLDEDIYHYRKGVATALTSQQRRKRKREYALNFIDLYQKYCNVPQEVNPVACIFDDILIQAGWYSIFYRLDLFKEYPWLAEAVRGAKIRGGGSDVPIVAQLLTKLVALFK
ncbi:MAG: glycosyltransferase family 2 protein [Alistipes sp.]|nr:glycosyltransferase family 2 protein [Alistipes sp.]